MSTKRLLAVLQGVAAFILWSTLAIFFNIVKLPIAIYVVFGSLVGLCLVYLYFFARKGGLPTFKLSWALVTLFLAAAVKGVVWFQALRIYPVADALIIHNLAPLIIVFFAPFILKEKVHLNHIIAILTGFIGLIVLLHGNSIWESILQLGVLYSLITAVSSSFQNIAQKHLAKTMTAGQQVFIFILGQALGSVLFLPGFSTQIQWIDLGYILFFGIFGTALPIILLTRAYNGLKSFELAALGYTEPLFGALWGSLFLHQALVPSTAIGGFLIFLSGLTVVEEKE